jgi:hypothetical protein
LKEYEQGKLLQGKSGILLWRVGGLNYDCRGVEPISSHREQVGRAGLISYAFIASIATIAY